MYALVLAGGSGTRLWPYSRSSKPKQFLSINGDQTMLQQTVARILPIVPIEQIYIATGAAYTELVIEQLPGLPRENILAEPSGRGTAPCIGWAALHLRRRDPEAVMAVLSADHGIERGDLFCEVLQAGEKLAQAGYLVTLGITPDEPSTGYGYIKRGADLGETSVQGAYQVAAFVEKPNAVRAKEYVQSGEYLWNAGMFVWRADRILEELNSHRPMVAEALQAIDVTIGGEHERHALETIWTTIENVAIDVAVMERTSHAAVIPANLGWSDVGDWAALAEALPSDETGNTVIGTHVGLETRGTLIYGNGRVIATIGLEDLVIVDTHDVLLICPRARVQDVKALVAQVREQHALLT
ncbi:MAG: mannose-1-phosphate guanylyltransferase [Roseiflexaceae bacterium]|nr:mannose-1-phosphate guanylyltransferase [Roseiflexaceae bacterium]